MSASPRLRGGAHISSMVLCDMPVQLAKHVHSLGLVFDIQINEVKEIIMQLGVYL